MPSIRAVGPFPPFIGARHPFLHEIIGRTRAISRFAFIMIAFSLAVSVAPLHPRVADGANRVLLAAFVVFLGWLVIVGVNLAIDRYIGRFKLDTSDNLLARKAVTQMRLLKRALASVLAVITVAFALMSFDSVREFGVSLFASAGVAGIAAGLAARPVLENLFAGVQLAIAQPIRLDDVLIIEANTARSRKSLRPTSSSNCGIGGGCRALELFLRQAVPELDADIRLAHRHGDDLCRLYRAGRSSAPQAGRDRQGIQIMGRSGREPPGQRRQG
ncbi:MAG: mechanosensitive ion channel family protein [Rhizomicrobium sp.]